MQNYDYSRLHSSLVGVIQEAQAKIGYDRHAITFYYPAASLAHMLGTKEDADTVEQALRGFAAFAQPTLGAVEVVRDDERFCIYVPAEGAEYVHEKVPDSGFLKAFLAVVSGLEVSLDDILAVFHRFSDEVVCEKIEGSDEFDYLVYFKNGEPDGYRYCIKLEDDGCASYHRFIREDYEAFGF